MLVRERERGNEVFSVFAGVLLKWVLGYLLFQSLG